MVLWLGGMVNIILWGWTFSRNTLSLGGGHPALTQMARLGLNPFFQSALMSPSIVIIWICHPTSPDCFSLKCLKKTCKNPTNQSKSHGVDLVLLVCLLVLWCFGGVVIMMFLLERHLTREYPKQVLDTSKTVKKSLKPQKASNWPAFFSTSKSLNLAKPAFPPLSMPQQVGPYKVSKLLRVSF